MAECSGLSCRQAIAHSSRYEHADGACGQCGKLPCKVGPAPSLVLSSTITTSGVKNGMPDSKGPSRSQRRALRRWRGQALVEFALVIPVFMLILGGVIQFGIYFWDQNTLNQIVRDAGRYAATAPDCLPASITDIQTEDSLLEGQTPFAGHMSVTATLPAPGSGPNCPPTSNADVAWVSIKADATVPVFFPLVNGAISSTASYRIGLHTPMNEAPARPGRAAFRPHVGRDHGHVRSGRGCIERVRSPAPRLSERGGCGSPRGRAGPPGGTGSWVHRSTERAKTEQSL